jgi:hypothetical protein
MEKIFYQVNGQLYYKSFDKAVDKAKEILWEVCIDYANQLPYTQDWSYDNIEILESPIGNFSVVLRDSKTKKCLTKRLVRKLSFED